MPVTRSQTSKHRTEYEMNILKRKISLYETNKPEDEPSKYYKKKKMRTNGAWKKNRIDESHLPRP